MSDLYCNANKKILNYIAVLRKQMLYWFLPDPAHNARLKIFKICFVRKLECAIFIA